MIKALVLIQGHCSQLSSIYFCRSFLQMRRKFKLIYLSLNCRGLKERIALKLKWCYQLCSSVEGWHICLILQLVNGFVVKWCLFFLATISSEWTERHIMKAVNHCGWHGTSRLHVHFICQPFNHIGLARCLYAAPVSYSTAPYSSTKPIHVLNTYK